MQMTLCSCVPVVASLAAAGIKFKFVCGSAGPNMVPKQQTKTLQLRKQTKQNIHHMCLMDLKSDFLSIESLHLVPFSQDLQI